jgi:PAS domain S-box-containing protein
MARKKIVLVVKEDGKASRELAAVLESCGYGVVTVPAEEKALKTLQDLPEVSLVFMDILPGEGPEGTRAAEIWRSCRNLPLVFLVDPDAPAFLKNTASSFPYIIKPVREKDIPIALEMARISLKEKGDPSGEAQWRLLFTANPNPMWIFDEETLRFLAVNEAAVSAYGWMEEEFLSFTVLDVRPPEERERARQIIEQNRNVRGARIGEFLFWRKDGTSMEMEVSASSLTFENRPARLSMLKDITERKLAEENLRESEDRYRSLIETTSDWIWEADAMGRCTYASPRVEEILGYAPGELIGRTAYDFMPEEERRRLRPILSEIAVLKQPFSFLENISRHKDGRPVVLETSGVPIFSADGTIAGYRGINRNITDRKRAEEERKKLEEQFHQMQKMESIGTLAGGIAHDFNNILSSVMGYAELTLLEVEEGSEAEDNLKHLLKAACRAKNLVKQILTFSRQGKIEKRPLDLRAMIAENLNFLRATLPTTIQIKQTMEQGSDLIEGDATDISQIIMNLCTNAAQAMGEGGGTLEVFLNRVNVNPKGEAAAQGIVPGGYLRLGVRDTGGGIPPDILKKIFDPYFTTKEVGKGTGLGLSVVQGIIKNYGGGITVSSEAGQGTLFEVYFPRLERKTDRPVHEKRGTLPAGNQERILVVDDEPEIAELVRRHLSRLNYKASVSTGSVEALDLIRTSEGSFDLVITDMAMPKMTGDKLAQEIINVSPGTPIILCTGFSEYMSEEKARAIRIREFLMKPVVREDLARAVRKVLDGGGQTGAEEKSAA